MSGVEELRRGAVPRTPQSHLLPPILCCTSSESPRSTDGRDVCTPPPPPPVRSRYHSGCVPAAQSGHNTRLQVQQGSGRSNVNAETVTAFLDGHTTFLEKYVLKNISIGTLQRWAQRRNKGNIPIQVSKSELHDKKIAYRYSMNMHSDKRKLFQTLLENINSNPTQKQVLYEMGATISAAVGVDGFNVFTVAQGDVNLFVGTPTEKSVHSVSILKSSLPVIHEVVKVGKPKRLAKKNTNSGVTGSAVSSNKDALYAMFLPIVTPDEDITAVLEMWRMTSAFYEHDEDIASSYLVWGSIALHYVHLYVHMTKQKKLQEFLLHVVESIFEDMGSMDVLVEKIMHFAQELVNADRASLFLVDSKTKELHATVFDVGIQEQSEDTSNPPRIPKEEIRFPIGVGIAGHVAKTGQILNIKDAYTDDRFNRSVDLKTGYRTKTILCMPVYIRNSVIGVVQMVNKKGEAFTDSDVEAFKMFATYCGLALHHAKLYNKIRRSEQKYKVALDVLSYHSTCREDDVKRMFQGIADGATILDDFYLNPFIIEDFDKVKDVIRMFKNLFGLERFDSACLARFVLTVKKNYREVPYHNWTHGFAVANTMYNILKRDGGAFKQNEKLALFIGALCHDLDHRGKNNKFMLDTESPLAAMYSTSTMEHHHFNQTVLILQQDGHNIFSQFVNSELKSLLSILKHCILATDLAVFFPYRGRLQTIVSSQSFSWDDSEHRCLALAISMTSADLSAAAKPWNIQTETVKVIFEEFYQQGDAERLSGWQPIPMMDRQKPEEQATSQVGFMKSICMPCYELLQHLLPSTQPLLSMCQLNLKRWTNIDQQVRNFLERHPESDIRTFVADLISQAY